MIVHLSNFPAVTMAILQDPRTRVYIRPNQPTISLFFFSLWANWSNPPHSQNIRPSLFQTLRRILSENFLYLNFLPNLEISQESLKHLEFSQKSFKNLEQFHPRDFLYLNFLPNLEISQKSLKTLRTISPEGLLILQLITGLKDFHPTFSDLRIFHWKLFPDSVLIPTLTSSWTWVCS